MIAGYDLRRTIDLAVLIEPVNLVFRHSPTHGADRRAPRVLGKNQTTTKCPNSGCLSFIHGDSTCFGLTRSLEDAQPR
jgi:hypothetical protein